MVYKPHKKTVVFGHKLMVHKPLRQKQNLVLAEGQQPCGHVLLIFFFSNVVGDLHVIPLKKSIAPLAHMTIRTHKQTQHSRPLET